MSDAQRTIYEKDIEDVLARRRIGHIADGGGSGGGGSMDDVIRRVGALEQNLQKIDGKIDKLTELVNSFGLKTSERLGGIEGRLTGIEKILEMKASTADLREVAGTVKMIPNIWQTLAIMAGLLVGVSGLAFTIAKWAAP